MSASNPCPTTIADFSCSASNSLTSLLARGARSQGTDSAGSALAEHHHVPLVQGDARATMAQLSSILQGALQHLDDAGELWDVEEEGSKILGAPTGLETGEKQ